MLCPHCFYYEGWQQAGVLLWADEAAKHLVWTEQICAHLLIPTHLSDHSYVRGKDAWAPAGSNKNTERYDSPVLIAMSDCVARLWMSVLGDNSSLSFFLLQQTNPIKANHITMCDAHNANPIPSPALWSSGALYLYAQLYLIIKQTSKFLANR